jgi:hypothetical protein
MAVDFAGMDTFCRPSSLLPSVGEQADGDATTEKDESGRLADVMDGSGPGFASEPSPRPTSGQLV